MHSAKWDSQIELKDKTVAVVGGGASAAQIIPAIAPIVESLHVYQRQPTHVLPLVLPQFKFPGKIKWLFTHFPIFMLIFRTIVFLMVQMYYFAVQANGRINRLLAYLAICNVKRQIPDNKQLQMKLTPNPDSQFMCRLPLTSANYLSTFNLPHVVANIGEIVEVKGNTIVTQDGNLEKFDVVILATGFRTSDYFAPMKIIGKNSGDILSKWKEEGPRLYWGIVSSSMPNFFHLLGPNGVTYGPLIFSIECAVNFAIKLIREMMNRKATSFNIKVEVENEYMEAMQEKMKTTVWHHFFCKSWVTDAQGVNIAFSPFHTLYFWWKTRSIDFSKFLFTDSN